MRVTANAARLQQVMDALGINDLSVPDGLDGQRQRARAAGGDGALRAWRPPDAPVPGAHAATDAARQPSTSRRSARSDCAFSGLSPAEASSSPQAIDWHTHAAACRCRRATSFRQVNIDGHRGRQVEHQPPDQSLTYVVLWSTADRVFAMVSIEGYRKRWPWQTRSADVTARRAAIETHALRKQFGADARRGRSLPVGGGRRDLRLPRAERRRQDHVDQDAAGAGRADVGSGRVLARRSAIAPRARASAFCRSIFAFTTRSPPRSCCGFTAGSTDCARVDLDARIDRLLTRVDLLDAADRPLRGYSKGMLQRVGLAQALLNDPQLVFLDEPTSGLDPLGRLLVRGIIDELRADGVTVFLNSHLLGEVEATCDRVAFVKRGRVVAECTCDTGRVLDLELRVTPADEAVQVGLSEFGTDIRLLDNGAIAMRIDSESRVPAIVQWARCA